ncbi:site-specific integrase [Arcobacter ellisii]|uniref:Site-specific tyrosine recombinase, phage integrase family n=1 Tax=Arcobacter ellisii TaxID=913109 RepID=A0A347UA13_9BACT|nr:site-specific integrase [Arcobacter ellisii]AXX95691.1 site-specific tyrosine recombinase, phage integrase family [Arcobacter ellisii]RXI31436.1 hypothetical protein CP962_04810 [Arcobacter ellisii]
MEYVKYVDEFPEINYTNKYLILKKYKNDFHIFYNDILKVYLPHLLNIKTLKLKTSHKMIELLSNGNWQELKYYPRIRESIITEDKIHFKDFRDWNDYFIHIDSKSSYPIFKTTDIKKRTHYGPAPFNLIAEFIIILASKGILKTPLYSTSLYFSNSPFVLNFFEKYFKTNQIYQELNNSLNFYFKSTVNKTFINSIILLSSNINYKNITDKNIENLQKYYKDNNLNLTKYEKKDNVNKKNDIFSYTNSQLEKLPLIFIKLGANVNTISQKKAKNKTIDDYFDYSKKILEQKRFNTNPQFKEMVFSFFKQLYLVDRLTIDTIRQKIRILLDFLKELVETFNHTYITKEKMQSYLDYPINENTYQKYLKEKEKKGVTSEELIRSQGIVIDFLNSTNLYYGIFKENTRVRFNSYKGATLFRESLDEEVYNLIIDILLNRPPYIKNLKKWGSVQCDWSNWWPHKVIPFLPLSLLLHLHLPLRSAHILNLDRDNFLLLNPDDSIKGFYINTDKNTSKKDLHIIPNIYKNELNIYKELIKLNKKMFPNLKKVKYKNDINSPWEEFYPLFPNFDGDNVMSRTIYEHYFKIVVLMAQFEIYNKNKDILIAWFENSTYFPKSINEIENLSARTIQTKVKLSFGLHSLRVTGATRLLRMGFPPQIIRLFTGHKGVNTLINIYLKIPHKELIESYFKISDNINTSTPKGLNNSLRYIPSSIVSPIKNKTPEKILMELKKNHLFTLKRIVTDVRKTTNTRIEIDNGLEVMSEIHWTHWQSYSFGICGKPDVCPIGAENRCSLCPYLATGPLFLQGVIIKTQQIQKRILVQSNIIAENRKLGQYEKNKSFHKQQSSDIEELAGWYEIISLIEKKIKEDIKDKELGNKIIKSKERDLQLVYYENVSEIDGLIKIYEEAKMLNLYNPDIEDTIYRLSSKIIKYCMNNNINEIIQYIDEPTKVIEWFIPQKEIKFNKKYLT